MIFAIPTDTCFWLACHLYDELSFNKIYELKNRSKNKHLSIAVRNFDELEIISNLNEEQITYLKKYPFPFTIITNLNEDFVYPDFLDKSIYKDFWIRVTDSFLITLLPESLEFPIFLTSANNSWEPELYNTQSVRENFWDSIWYIVDSKIETRLPSNIFRFKWDSTEQDFVRKNY